MDSADDKRGGFLPIAGHVLYIEEIDWEEAAHSIDRPADLVVHVVGDEEDPVEMLYRGRWVRTEAQD